MKRVAIGAGIGVLAWFAWNAMLGKNSSGQKIVPALGIIPLAAIGAAGAYITR